MMQNGNSSATKKLRFEETIRLKRSDRSSNVLRFSISKISHFDRRREISVNVAAKGRERRDVWIKEGRVEDDFSVSEGLVLQVSRSLRKIKIWRAIQRQASGPCIKGVLTGVSRGKKAETGKERRGTTSGRTQKRDANTLVANSWSRREKRVDAFPSSRLLSSLVNHDTLRRKIGKVKINIQTFYYPHNGYIQQNLNVINTFLCTIG